MIAYREWALSLVEARVGHHSERYRLCIVKPRSDGIVCIHSHGDSSDCLFVFNLVRDSIQFLIVKQWSAVIGITLNYRKARVRNGLLPKL